MADSASSIQVCVRVRPFTVREAAQLSHVPDGPVFLGDGSLAGAPTPKLSQKGLRSVIKVVDDKCLVFDPPEDNPVQKFSRSVLPAGKRTKDQTFGFDRVFDDNVSQADVYDGTTRTLLDSVLDGYNATVFAYGATGCGKTHTITGTVQQPGIIFLTMQELFERIAERADEKVAEISLSYLEIYNETIRDLLVPGGSKQGLMLREDSHQAVSVAGLSSHHPQNVQEVMDIIVRGNEFRTMSPTEANATSSRSHAVLQINISQKDRNASVNEPHTMATLSIIDLAGSERASATKNRGERLLEGANINKSLLALGSCINALCDPRKKNHVPYRNSKLTRLLKFSLGGNCRTVMIVCVSPSSAHFDETQNTLRYANRAKNIQTKVTRNVYNVNRHVKDFLVKIDEQMALINELKAQQKDYETVAFAKFRKQAEKRDGIAREGITRIRNAYEHSATERNEKISSMKKLRQVERRIATISAWVDAFDQVVEAHDDDSVLQNIQAMRKTAQGILMELESSRHHFHTKIGKNNWERAVDSALQNGLRQLKEVDGQEDGHDVANLSREAEILKSMAEREALASVAEQEKAGEAATVQVLLKAHFETMAAVQMLTKMDEEEAVQAAQGILGNVLQSCIQVTSHVVKPDGSLAPVEPFAPTKNGTPKRKKSLMMMPGGTPIKLAPMAALAPPSQMVAPSPLKSSPKRRKYGAAKKAVMFSPRKSPAKPPKRGVRWRDENEEGNLAEFEKTPQKFASTPEISSAESMLPPPLPPQLTIHETDADVDADADADADSSPIPQPPEVSAMDKDKPKSSRFQSGFLAAKKPGVSPHVRNVQLDGSSDSEPSPLRSLDPSNASNRSSLPRKSLRGSTSPVPKRDDGVQSGSESGVTSGNEENADPSDGDADSKSNSLRRRQTEALQVRKAVVKRHSLAPSVAGANGGLRTAHRRRSPTAADRGSSPPSADGRALFTASHARRMVRSERASSGSVGGHAGTAPSVLSPRSQPVLKSGAAPARRMTLSVVAGESNRHGHGPSLATGRMSAASLNVSRTDRASLAAGVRSGWR